jgi:hypothetical protein
MRPTVTQVVCERPRTNGTSESHHDDRLNMRCCYTKNRDRSMDIVVRHAGERLEAPFGQPRVYAYRFIQVNRLLKFACL